MAGYGCHQTDSFACLLRARHVVDRKKPMPHRRKQKRLTHDTLALMLDPRYDPDRNFAALHRLIRLYAV